MKAFYCSFFTTWFWAYFSALQTLVFLLVQSICSSSGTLLPSLQLFTPCPHRAVLAGQRTWKLGLRFIIPPFSAHACFTFDMFFSLCCFFLFLFFSNSGLSRVTLFCSLINPDTSTISPAQHWCIKNELSHQWSCLFFSFILVCLFQWAFPHSLFFCQNLCSSLILNLSIFFSLSLFVLNNALFLAHRGLFHGWLVLIRVWKTLRLSSFSNESLYSFLFIFLSFFQDACSHYWIYYQTVQCRTRQYWCILLTG